MEVVPVSNATHALQLWLQQCPVNTSNATKLLLLLPEGFDILNSTGTFLYIDSKPLQAALSACDAVPARL